MQIHCNITKHGKDYIEGNESMCDDVESCSWANKVYLSIFDDIDPYGDQARPKFIFEVQFV